MVKHIILWKLKDEIADKASVKAGIKAGLEGLKGVVPGLVDIVVNTEGLASSTADVMLDFATVLVSIFLTHTKFYKDTCHYVVPFADLLCNQKSLL